MKMMDMWKMRENDLQVFLMQQKSDSEFEITIKIVKDTHCLR